MPLLTELGNIFSVGFYKDAAPTALKSAQRLFNPRHHAFFAEDLEQVVEAGAGGLAGQTKRRQERHLCSNRQPKIISPVGATYSGIIHHRFGKCILRRNPRRTAPVIQFIHRERIASRDAVAGFECCG